VRDVGGIELRRGRDGSSDRDTLAKRKIARREIKETRYRLRVLRKCGFLTNAQDPLIDESDELVKILATLVNKHPDGK
jgi:four helix bundle protein